MYCHNLRETIHRLGLTPFLFTLHLFSHVSSGAGVFRIMEYFINPILPKLGEYMRDVRETDGGR